MITPEPIAPPCVVCTLISTTAGLTFAITASRTASILLLLSGGIVATGVCCPCCNGAGFCVVAVLLRPNSQPAAKTTTPKRSATSIVTSTASHVRDVRRPGPGGVGGTLLL